MSKWKDVVKGDVVKMSGRECRVVKIKPKGKKARVMLDVRGRYSEGEVKLADKVKIVSRKTGGKLHGSEGEQRRWATEPELAEAMSPIPAGDPAQTKPPAKADGDPWERPVDRVERKLDELLGARLVAEAKNEAMGYYVPPVDVSTVASHLALFHGGIPEACTDEAMMIRAHEAQHVEALRGAALPTNHWHTEKRP